MLRHYVKHLGDILIIFLLLSSPMRLKLLNKLLLVVLINIRNLLRRQLVFILALDSPEDNLVSV